MVIGQIRFLLSIKNKESLINMKSETYGIVSFHTIGINAPPIVPIYAVYVPLTVTCR
jgi:hypothetical protein